MESIVLAKTPADCCGCGACLSVCPRQAISMVPDLHGWMYPQIDDSKCIQCGRCVNICQYTKELEEKLPAAVYAAVGRNTEMVKNSASGGIFAALAESVVQNGGLVAGAVMDCDGSTVDVYHLLSSQESDLCRMQGSKYVQSEAWRCYQQVMQALKTGKTVLFSGTPCQVAAVKNLTGDPKNLVTVDLICHGVPSRQMLNDYLKILAKRLRGEITGFRFRDKSCSKQYTAAIDVRRGQMKKRVYIKSSLLSFYKYFLNGSVCRENCFSCPYACGSRVSDITIGDYWGVEEFHRAEFHQGIMPGDKDWSCVLVNTEKGESCLKNYGEQIFLYPSQWEWVTEKNQQLKEPALKAKNREQLLKMYRESGYSAVESEFIRKNGGKIRFYWRLIRNIFENDHVIGSKHEN